jgi:TRAP-type transport system periplasmic protein
MKRNCTKYVLAAMFFVVMCLTVQAGFAQDKVITLRYSNQFPPSDQNTMISEQWCKEVEKRTNGRIRVRHYPVNVLNPQPQMFDSVLTGVVDIGNVMGSAMKGRFPLMSGVDQVPWNYQSAHQAAKMANAAYAKFKPKELDDVKIMYFHCTPDGKIHTVKKPVIKLEDVKGLKMRVWDAHGDILKSYGAVTVMIPQVDVYDGLSKGIVDGVTSVYQALQMWKTTDYLKFSTELKGALWVGTFFVAMNKNKWNSIPPADQKIIEQINQEWVDKHGLLWDKLEKEGKDFAIKAGVKITQLSAEEQAKWDAKAEPCFDKYVKQMKEKNLPGEEMIKFVRDNLK